MHDKTKRVASTFPELLQRQDHWIVWVDSDDETDPTGVDPSTGQKASSDDPSTWGSFKEAQSFDPANTAESVAGDRLNDPPVGFVLDSSDPYVVLKVTDCIDPQSGEVDPWVTALWHGLKTYAEVDSSGTTVSFVLDALGINTDFLKLDYRLDTNNYALSPTGQILGREYSTVRNLDRRLAELDPISGDGEVGVLMKMIEGSKKYPEEHDVPELHVETE